MENILLYVGVVLGVIGYLAILVLYISSGKKKEEMSGFDMAFKLLEDDTSSKIVEGKGLIFSKYNIARDVIKLSSKDYRGEDAFSLGTAGLLAGYALTGKKSSYLSLISKVFKNYRFVSFSGIIAMMLSGACYGSGDAKMGIILLVLILFYQYMLFNFVNEATLKVKEKIDNVRVIKVLDTNIRVHFLMMGSTFVLIARMVMFLINR